MAASGWRTTTRILGEPLPSAWTFAREFALMNLGYDLILYPVHRALHLPVFYARFHKVGQAAVERSSQRGLDGRKKGGDGKVGRRTLQRKRRAGG